MNGDVAAEVIVVGAGHNGLICAAYLARAGVDTLLLEARDDVGGCASTVSDLGARFNICNCDHSMVRAMPVIDELDLESYGLRYLEPVVGNVHRFYDGSPSWLFVHDTDAHLDALAQTHPHAVEGYRRYLRDAMPVAELILEMARTKPSLGAMSATVLRRRAAGAARGDEAAVALNQHDLGAGVAILLEVGRHQSGRAEGEIEVAGRAGGQQPAALQALQPARPPRRPRPPPGAARSPIRDVRQHGRRPVMRPRRWMPRSRSALSGGSHCRW